jgi:hypothetical protein
MDRHAKGRREPRSEKSSASPVPTFGADMAPENPSSPPRPPEWDGFSDPWWNLGQLILWVATGDRGCVDRASDDCNRLGTSYGLAASAVILEEQTTTEQRAAAVKKIQAAVLRGKIVGYSNGAQIPAITWVYLKINFDCPAIPGIYPGVYWISGLKAFGDLRFSRSEALQLFADITDAPKPKPGAKIKFDWPDAKDKALQLLNERGEFKEWDSAGKWRCRADLEQEILEYMQKSGEEPSKSSVKSYAKLWLGEWRAREVTVKN